MSNTQPTHAETTPFLFARTKLRPPRLRTDTLPRPRLVDTIQRSVANARLALVSAPAGYGKTTLVANAVNGLPETKVAWLTLDSEDNELLRFLSAFVSALQPVAPLFAAEAAGILVGAGRGDQRHATLLGRAVMTALINELFENESPHCIVIDDLHYVSNEEVHSTLNFLIERLPPHVTLVIATRHDPSLALSQLRARREMVELRLEELRFTSEETSTLWNQQLGLPLTAAELTTLMKHTEGWAAGMTLLSASLGKLDTLAARSAFLDQFKHSHRFVFDYLAEAVFSREDAITRDFLVATSILDELSIQVCSAVSGRADAERILDDLYRRNLFLIGSETQEQTAYRYHDIFRDFLQERARRESAETMRHWHRCAAQAMPQPARKVNHYLLAEAYSEAADVIEQAAFPLILQGWATLVRRWIRQLPTAVLEQRPKLTYWLGHSAFVDWDMAEARRWLTQARNGLQVQGHTVEETAALVDLALCLAGMTLNEEAAHLLQEATVRQLTLTQQIQVSAVKVYLALEQADLPEIRATISEIIGRVEQQPDSAALNVLAVAMHYPWLMEPGGLPIIERLAKLFERHATQNPMLEAMAHVWYSRSYRLRGEWGKTLKQISLAQAISKRLGGSFNIDSETADNCICLAFLGSEAEAEVEMAQFLAEMRAQPSWTEVWSAIAHFLFANMRWNQGRIAECEAYYQQLLAHINPSERAYSAVMREMVRGLLLLSAKRYDTAAEAFVQASTHRSAMPSLIYHAQTMLAHTYFLQGNHDLALKTFVPVLQVYAAEGTPGVVRYMGPRLVEPLLALAVTHNQQSEFARGILTAINPTHPALGALRTLATTATLTQPVRIPDTGETLSERELEVLRLLVRGAENATIAEELIVSIHTVKTHVAHILAKLGVPSRTVAAIKAKELGLMK